MLRELKSSQRGLVRTAAPVEVAQVRSGSGAGPGCWLLAAGPGCGLRAAGAGRRASRAARGGPCSAASCCVRAASGASGGAMLERPPLCSGAPVYSSAHSTCWLRYYRAGAAPCAQL
jgi:hypothetical protein